MPTDTQYQMFNTFLFCQCGSLMCSEILSTGKVIFLRFLCPSHYYWTEDHDNFRDWTKEPWGWGWLARE